MNLDEVLHQDDEQMIKLALTMDGEADLDNPEIKDDEFNE